MRSLIFGLSALASGMALADSQAPSIPDGVQAVASSSDSIQVTWNAASDNEGVDGYNVYRDGRYRSTVFDTDYTDYGVERGDRHSYEVVAFDEARNYTEQSVPASATAGGEGSGSGEANTTRSSGRPGTPGTPGVSAQDDGSIRVTWSESNGDVKGYNVYRDGGYKVTVRDNEYTDQNVESGRDYRYAIVAFSNDGRFSSKSDETRVRSGEDVSETRSVVDDDNDADTRTDAGSDSGGVPSSYELVFSDEFRGSSLDSRKWNSRYRWGPDWVINSEQQYYVDILREPDFGENPFSFNGEHLTISATRTPDSLRQDANSQRWLSGALTTYENFSMKYGFVEIRAKLPRGNGLWPAFWLLHESNTDRRPEIDVVEMLGRDPDTVYQTYHYYDNHSLRSTPSYRVEKTDYSQEFHTYGMLWEPGKVIWFVDGRETNRFESDKVSYEDMYLLLNLAVGGSWAGSPDDNTESTAHMSIDYIRAYRR